MKRCRLSKPGDDDDIFPLSARVSLRISLPENGKLYPTFHHLPPRKKHCGKILEHLIFSIEFLKGFGGFPTVDEGNICKSNRRTEKAPLFTKYVKHPSYFLDSSLHSLFALTFSWPDIFSGNKPVYGSELFRSFPGAHHHHLMPR